jgi:hypothetical protein
MPHYSSEAFLCKEVFSAKGKRQKAKGKRQKAKGKRQKAKGKRQKAKGKRQRILGGARSLINPKTRESISEAAGRNKSK